MSEIILNHVRWSGHSLLVWIHGLIRHHIRAALHLLIEHHTLITLALHVADVLRSALRIHRILLDDWTHDWTHHLWSLISLLRILWNRILSKLSRLRLLNYAAQSVNVSVLIIRYEPVIRFLVGHIEQNKNFNVAL